MKKIIALMMVLVLAFALAACSNTTQPAATPAPTEEPAETEAPEEDATEEPAETAKSDD